MNPWQMALQIRHKLRTVAWAGDSGAVVFGSRGARIIAGLPTEEQIPPAYPWALISIGPGTADETHPDLLEQTFTIYVAVLVMGDALGEQALVGGPASLTASAGRGVAEVSAQARSAVENQTGSDGAHLILSSVATGEPVVLGGGRHLAMAEMTVDAVCTSALYYHPPQEVYYDGTAWTWNGDQCSNRYDFLQYRLVEKSGTSPSSDPSDGTVVYTGSTARWAGYASADNTYTVFADYDARGSGTVEDSSEPEVGSYLVVT